MSNAISIRPPENRDLFELGFSGEIFDEMQSIHDEIERAAFALFQKRGDTGTPLDDWLHAESNLVTPVNISIKDDKDELTVIAGVPGFSVNELKVYVDGSELRICGTSEATDRKDKESSTTTRRVCCTVILPTAVKSENASATLDKGVLTLKLPKAEPAKKIEVKAVAA